MLLQSVAFSIGLLAAGSPPTQPVLAADPEEKQATDEAGIGKDTHDSDQRSKVTISKEDALARSRRVLGELPEGATLRAEGLVDVGSLNLPFIRHEVAGQQAWHIVVENWRLLPGRNYEEKDQVPRIWDVFLSAQDGRVLRIASRWPADVPPIPPLASAESAERQMAPTRGDGLGDEVYHALPEAEPSMSLSEALDATGYEEPVWAQQVVAQYVVWSIKGTKWSAPRAVWAITLRGIPPFDAAYPGIVPIDYRNHMRYIVDPATRKWISATTTPQPARKDVRPIVDVQDDE